jgi:hypothetical protein
MPLGGSVNWPPSHVSTIEEYTPPVVGVEDQGENNPAEFTLHQNYPNPFNPVTRIRYEILNQTYVALKITNIQGQEVRTLVNKEQPVGNYEVLWDGRDNSGKQVASGVYMYKLEAGQGFVQTRKMVLLR